MKFYSQLNTSGSEPPTSDTPVSHSIDIPTEELKILWSLELHSFLPQYPLRLASTSTKQPTSYTHTWTDTLIMKYQRRNSATRGQSSHNVYTRALNEILFTTEHVWERTPDLWHTSQSLYRHTHRGAKNIVIIGTTQLPPTIPAPTRKHIDKATNITWTDTLIMKYQRRNIVYTHMNRHTDNEISEKE